VKKNPLPWWERARLKIPPKAGERGTSDASAIVVKIPLHGRKTPLAGLNALPYVW
jgi:hypothetical protein